MCVIPASLASAGLTASSTLQSGNMRGSSDCVWQAERVREGGGSQGLDLPTVGQAFDTLQPPFLGPLYHSQPENTHRHSLTYSHRFNSHIGLPFKSTRRANWRIITNVLKTASGKSS